MKIEKITPQILACYCGTEARFYGASDLWGIYSVGATGAVVLENGIYTGVIHEDNLFVEYDLILRRLESMTEEEARDVFKLRYEEDWRSHYEYENDNECEDVEERSALRLFWNSEIELYADERVFLIGNPEVWIYLLSKGFDLFGLIPAGLAKEVTVQTT